MYLPDMFLHKMACVKLKKETVPIALATKILANKEPVTCL